MYSMEIKTLINEIYEGTIVPTEALDGEAFVKGKQLNIRLNDSQKEMDEVVLFFWHYEDKKPLYVRKSEIKNGYLVWQDDATLRMQMKFIDVDSLRLAIAIKTGEKITCGYIRNKAAQGEKISSADRLVGKLFSKDKEALIVYWTEGGILSVKTRSESAFDNEYYRVILCGAKWENDTFVGYLEMPLFSDEPQIDMYSMTTNESCNCGRIKITKEGFTGLKNVYRMTINLTESGNPYEDGYYFACHLDGHKLAVYADEFALENEKIHTVIENNTTFDVMAVREKNGLFVLQVADKIYPVMISVITIVYNEEALLAERINSLLMQKTGGIDEYIIGNETKDYKKRKYQQLFEIIMIDDGSMDGSSKILDDYARMSDKIRIIHKDKGGELSAREAGVENSKGKYLVYADDIVNNDFIKQNIDFIKSDIRCQLTEVKREQWLICKKRLFSIIMSIYNVELYIEEAIQSIIEQSIGFSENVQLILVNDGSTDASVEICEKYAQEFPNNIIHINKENGGLSSARNVGLEYADGVYVNFFDPDDVLSKNVLMEVKKFFDKNDSYVDMVCIPLVYFEAQTGLHAKYETLGFKNRVISLVKEPHNFILSAASSFYKLEVFKSLRFDERMLTAEDTKVNLQVLRRTMHFGYVCENGVTYNYRRRNNGSSNVDAITSGANKEALLAPIYIFEDLYPKEGYLAPYEKELLAYELRSRLRTIKKEKFSEKEYKEILDNYGKWIHRLDDEFIAKSKWLDMIEKKVLFLMLSNRNFGDWVRKGFSDLSDRIIRVHWLSIENSKVRIVCRFNNFQDNDIDLILVKRNERNSWVFACENTDVEGPYDLCIGEIITDVTHTRTYELPLNNAEYYFAYYDRKTGNVSEARRCSIYAKARCAANTKGVGPVSNGYCVSLWNNNVWITNNQKVVNNITQNLQTKIGRELPLRKLAKSEKKYILISDRPEKAGDNGEALFEYIMENEPEEIKTVTFFVINKRCKDYRNMKFKDHVIDFRSKEHLEKFLNAKVIYSSHNAVNFFYPFEPSQYSWYADLLSYKFVWLQHGVTKDNIQKEANKLNTMDDFIVTASTWEFSEFNKTGYLYSEGDILFSGFARFDKLNDTKQKKIIVAPTWRKELVGKILPNGHNEPKAGFTESKFYSSYIEFLTDKKLIDVLEKEDYHLDFVLHSGFTCYEDMFKCINMDRIHLIPLSEFSYNKEFCESALFITDFSSTAFDFAYMRKPVIYFQFDEKEFFENHYVKGTWDYRKDGLGSVVTETKELVDEVTKYLENGCKMSEKYQRRVEEQFTYSDKNSCKRIMDATRKCIV